MRFIRLFGVVVIFYSMTYLLHALMQLTSSALHPGRTELFKYIAINLPIGIVTFTIGIGLLLAKEWARIAWLVTAFGLLILHAVLLRVFYGSEEDFSQQLLNVVMIVLLVLISINSTSGNKMDKILHRMKKMINRAATLHREMQRGLT